MTINVGGEDITVVAETAQQLGNSRVRAICMKPTDGLIRGTEVRNLGHPLQMPVGDGVLGHVLNVLGEPLDVERSEEHTSELQSLMRNSYADFCLTKKITSRNN